MGIYSITYDLRNKRDYEKLYEAIRAYSQENWAKPTESQWLIATNKTATQINSYLSNYVDEDDVVMVVKIDQNDCAAMNIRKEVAEWLGLS